MNRLILFSHDQVKNDHYLVKDSKRIEHIIKVLKAKVGDQIKICLLNDGIGIGIIETISSDLITIKDLEIKKGSLSNINLLVGLSRPQTCKKILEHGSSLGVQSFSFFNTTLSEKSYIDSKIFQNEKFKEYMHDGISQSACFYQEPSFSLSTSAQHISLKQSQNFILSPFAKKTFANFPIDFTKDITLAIGPERGWTTKEVEHFSQKDFQEIKISESILRVEIATFVAIGQLDMLRPN